LLSKSLVDQQDYAGKRENQGRANQDVVELIRSTNKAWHQLQNVYG